MKINKQIILNSINNYLFRVRARQPYNVTIILLIIGIWITDILLFAKYYLSTYDLTNSTTILTLKWIALGSLIFLGMYHYSKLYTVEITPDAVYLWRRWQKHTLPSIKILKNTINSIVIKKSLIRRLFTTTFSSPQSAVRSSAQARSTFKNFFRLSLENRSAYRYYFPLFIRLQNNSEIKLYIRKSDTPYFEAAIHKNGYPLVDEQKVLIK